MKKVALIVAGGKGERMGSEIPKQFLLLKKLPILMYTIKQFVHFEQIVLVLPKIQFDYWHQLCKDQNFNLALTLVEGGETRFQSVKNGLEKIPNGVIVAIHDAVRPLVSKSLIDNLISVVKNGVGSVPIFEITDSIRKVEAGSSKSISRKNLFKVQTPQCFLSSNIKDAYSKIPSKDFSDDASVFETLGGEIKPIAGERKNLKITTKEDLKIAELFMQ